MRLIDSDAEVYGYVETWICNCSGFGRQSVMAVEDISYLPEIDPETLPIVQELRKELERVTKERDAAVSEIESIIAYGLHLPNSCPFCKNEQCKMRGGTEPCIPKWRGIQEAQDDE